MLERRHPTVTRPTTPPTPPRKSSPLEHAAGDRPPSPQERLDHAREVIRVEARTIARLEERLDERFLQVVDLALACRGTIVVTGMGKAGLIGQKISATMASTGTPSIFLHPAEALHGDLGRIRAEDLVLALSNSGETAEIKLVVPAARRIGARLVAMTGRPESSLGRLVDCVLDIGVVDEACPLGLAPTASTSAMLALGDALAMQIARERNFSREDYARFHPAGSLGRRLLRVREVMREGAQVPLAALGTALGDVIDVMDQTPGRPGAALITDADGRLAGIFTDGDLRRRLRERRQVPYEEPIDAYLVREPKCLRPDQLIEEAEHLLSQFRIDQIPVVDEDGKPIGLIDVQDLLDTRA